jgi:hypothetical protein
VADGVRETTLKSVDNGETWQTWFDLVFRSRAQGTAASEDGIIARLDKEYQAAVKHNDAANMDRILADDFVLVTGTGNKITKPDLLAQARSGRISYEQQDELEQFVRVWAMRRWSRGSFGRRAQTMARRSITSCGSATLTSAPRQAGVTCSGRHRAH